MVDLRDSSTYQMIVEEGLAKGMAQGMAQGLRRMLIKMAARHLGPPSEVVEESLSAIDDFERLQRMGQRALDVATWQELLETT